MATDTPARTRLPWTAVAAATVLAALAALLVIVVMGGVDGDESATAADGSFELAPVDAEAGGDPLQVEVEWPEQEAAGTLAADLEGPAVVNFFASWCAPCIAEMPDFEEVFQDVEGRVDFVGLAVSDRTADARRIVEQTGITYRWARDERGDVANAARVTQMPATMFVGADGEVVAVRSGALDADQLRDLIDEHLGVAVDG
jgi:thiol-disulfide isomerase/thioredoxin